MSRSALRIADAINVGVSAVQEPALVSTEVAESYGGANYPRALLVLTEVDLDAAIEALGGVGSVVAWLGLVDRATAGLSAAIDLAGSDAIDRSVGRLRRLNRLERRPDGIDPRPASRCSWPPRRRRGGSSLPRARSSLLSTRGTSARTAGLPEEAALQFGNALKQAQGLEPSGGMLTAVILGTMGNVAEASPMVEALVAAGQLPPGMAASLFLRVGDPAAAANEIAKLDATGSRPGADQPLDEAVIRGEVAAANGAWEAAARATDPALAAFELRVARLSRDVLRIFDVGQPRRRQPVHDGDPDSPRGGRPVRRRSIPPVRPVSRHRTRRPDGG